MTNYDKLTNRQKNIYDSAKEIWDKSGNTRRNGEAYFNHCWRVWLNFNLLMYWGGTTQHWIDMMFFVCIHHDTVEDEVLTIDELEKLFEGAFGGIVNFEYAKRYLSLLKHEKTDGYGWYINNIKQASINEHDNTVILIKISDILDNISDPGCSEKQRAKYRNALEILRS